MNRSVPSNPSATHGSPPVIHEWILLAAGMILLLRYAWLLDDAFVYFRYVDNALFLRIGLVYNAGEYVEGFSSPAWVLLLLLLRSMHLPFFPVILGIGAFCWIAFWRLLVAVNRAFSPPDTPIVNLPLAFLCLNYAVQSYFTSGTETPMVQVAAALFALHVMRPASRPLQLALALTPLVRPELAMPLAISLAYTWSVTGRLPRLMATVAVLAFVSWTTFRILYYADLVPNTFHLKNASWYRQGFLYLLDGVRPYHLPALLLACAAALFVPRSRLRANGAASRLALHVPQRVMLLLLAFPVALFVVRIGGDPRHYRFLAFPFCVAACACAGIPEHLLAAWGRSRPRRGLAACGAITVAVLCSLCHPRQLDRPLLLPGVHHRGVDGINDAQWHRRLPVLHPAAWEDAVTPAKLAQFRRVTPTAQIHRPVRAFGLCAPAYINFTTHAVNRFGLTDGFLSRFHAPAVRPAHKPALKPIADELAGVLEAAPTRGPGMFRAALDSPYPPAWIAPNIETLDLLERKIYNRHRFGENLGIALATRSRMLLMPPDAPARGDRITPSETDPRP